MTSAIDTGFLWLLILLVGVGTIGIRLSFILLFGWIDEIPPSVEGVLQYIPAAVLAGLIVPAVIYIDGSLAVSPDNSRLLAAALAGVVAWRTENMLVTLAVGMGAFWFLQLGPW